MALVDHINRGQSIANGNISVQEQDLRQPLRIANQIAGASTRFGKFAKSSPIEVREKICDLAGICSRNSR